MSLKEFQNWKKKLTGIKCYINRYRKKKTKRYKTIRIKTIRAFGDDIKKGYKTMDKASAAQEKLGQKN